MTGEFGAFIREKRTNQHITLRKLASDLGIVPAYMSDIEKGRRYPPDKEKLFRMAELLQLTPEEQAQMFDLAAGEKAEGVSQDISDYIMDDKLVRVALRTAKKNNVSQDKWEQVIRLFNDEARVNTLCMTGNSCKR